MKLAFGRLFKWSRLWLIALSLTCILPFLFDYSDYVNTGFFSRHHVQNFLIKADKWIIIQRISLRTDWSLVSDVPGWRILISSDDEIDSIWHKVSCKHCLIWKISIHAGSAEMIAAFLHAVDHGAKWIYVTNDVSRLSDQLRGYNVAALPETGLMYSSRDTFDPYRHFLSPVGPHFNVSSRNMYQLGEWPSPLLYQKWRPDQFRTLAANVEDLYNRRSPPALVPAWTLAKIKIINSLFHRNSSWVLISLANKQSTLSALSWSFWVQRMLWELQRPIAIMRPLVPPTNKIDFCDKCVQPTKHQWNSLVNVVRSWTCKRNNTFFTCAKQLSERMVTAGHFKRNDVEELEKWLISLKKVGYDEPLRILDKLTVASAGATVVNEVIFWPSGKTGREVQSPINPNMTYINPFSPVCQRAKSVNPSPWVKAMTPVRKIQDILLIIIFNTNDLYPNIQFLEYVYGRHFANILYCGSSLKLFQQFNAEYSKPVSFLYIETSKGFTGYQCMLAAMTMGYDVNGYLQMGDDVLLNSWNVNKLPREKLWFQSDMRMAKLSSKKVPDIAESPAWWPWNRNVGKRAMLSAWKDLMAMLVSQKNAPRVKKFLKTLEENSGGKERVFYQAADILYVPRRLQDDFIFFTKPFLKHSVFLEITIPTILNGIDKQANIVGLSGTYLWHQHRKEFPSYYNTSHVFLHPWKLKAWLSNTKNAKFLCQKYLLILDKDLRL